MTVDSAINTDPRDLASRDAIDRNAPNPNICQTYGSSAMVVDQRVFVTFNPFSLHVSQVRWYDTCSRLRIRLNCFRSWHGHGKECVLDSHSGCVFLVRSTNRCRGNQLRVPPLYDPGSYGCMAVMRRFCCGIP